MSNNIHLTLKATYIVYLNLNYTLSGTLWNWLGFLVIEEQVFENGQKLG